MRFRLCPDAKHNQTLQPKYATPARIAGDLPPHERNFREVLKIGTMPGKLLPPLEQ
jgi:hypothetical protein